MNTFATIEDFQQYTYIGYYSVKAENKDISEVDDFFERHENSPDPEVVDQLERLTYWIEQVGERYDDYKDSFRHEGACEALPLQTKATDDKIDLRLYCHRVTDNVIILFNGGLKTARTPQECPNVKVHHRNAENWTRQLKSEDIETEDTAIINKEEILINY